MQETPESEWPDAIKPGVLGADEALINGLGATEAAKYLGISNPYRNGKLTDAAGTAFEEYSRAWAKRVSTALTETAPTRHHATKKSPAQLDREIAEALHSPSGRQPLRPARSANVVTLAKFAKKANEAIYDLTHNKYFGSVPIAQLFAIVENAGFRFDPDEKDVILTGRDGKATWFLYDPETDKSVNHMLVLNWHKLENSGRYEIVAYVS